MCKLDLRLFDGAAGAGSAGTAGGAAGAAESGTTAAGKAAEPRVVYGKQAEAEIPAREPEAATTASTQEDRRKAFEARIKGEDKDLFDERVQRIINERFKNQKALEKDSADLKAARPVLELLAGKYGVKADDLAGLQKAIEADNAYYEDEALRRGVSVEQLKEIKRLERENAEFKRAAAERERRTNAEKVYSTWMQQAEDAKRFYPGFDLQSELNADGTKDRFVALLRSGVDVKTAYEVIHKDELIGGAMQYAARVTEQRTVENIRARGNRPRENGGGTAPAVIVKKDPKQFTRKDREEISRRVMRGERIEL